MYATFNEAQAASLTYYNYRCALAIVRVERIGGAWQIQSS